MKKTSKMRVVLTVIGAVLLFIAFVQIIIWITTPRSSLNISVLEDGWDVKSEAGTFENVSEEELAGIFMDSFDSGSSISYSHKLTLDCTDMDYPALLMEMNRTICTIYIDDDLIFDSSAPSNAGTFDAPVFCFAAIPKGVYENSTITINLIAMDSYVYRKSTPVMVGEYNDLFRNIIDVFRFPIMITVFIIMFGGIMLFLFRAEDSYVFFALYAPCGNLGIMRLPLCDSCPGFPYGKYFAIHLSFHIGGRALSDY